MDDIKIKSLLLVSMWCLISFIMISPLTFNDPSDFTGSPNPPIIKEGHEGLRCSYNASLMHIDDKNHGDYNWSKAVEQPWCNGSGTSSDPYVIFNLTIIGKGNETFCLMISNSSSKVIIKDSVFNNSNGIGIKLVNVSNVMIQNCNLSKHSGSGIEVSNSSSITLKNNTISKSNQGLYFELCNNCTIKHNELLDNTQDGLLFDQCDNCRVDFNIFRDNYYGVRLHESKSNYISNNVFRSHDNWPIILLSNSNANTIISNDLNYNEFHLARGISCTGNKFIDNGYDPVILQNEELGGNPSQDDEPFQVDFLFIALLTSIIVFILVILIVFRVMKSQLQEHAPIPQKVEQEKQLEFQELYKGVYECVIEGRIPNWLSKIIKNKKSGKISEVNMPSEIKELGFSKMTFQQEGARIILKGYE